MMGNLFQVRVKKLSSLPLSLTSKEIRAGGLPRMDGQYNFVSKAGYVCGSLSHVSDGNRTEWSSVRDFIYIFSRRDTGFHRRAKLLELNFPLDSQPRWAKSSSQLVNLHGAQPLMKPLVPFGL